MYPCLGLPSESSCSASRLARTCSNVAALLTVQDGCERSVRADRYWSDVIRIESEPSNRIRVIESNLNPSHRIESESSSIGAASFARESDLSRSESRDGDVLQSVARRGAA